MESTNTSNILTINAGSSSIKLALFSAKDKPEQFYEASIENIGQPKASLFTTGKKLEDNTSEEIEVLDHITATKILVDKLKTKTNIDEIIGIGHRIVHGGPDYYQPCLITSELVEELKKITFFNPIHLPLEIQLIESFKKLFPDTKQFACFDTAFHHDMPDVAKRLPIPRHYDDEGMRRYGFHGLSFAYIIERLNDLAGPDVANGRVVIAHMGNGVSLVAVKDGKSIDTTMGMTPASGVPMSTRSGDLDPGLPLFFSRHENLDANQFNDLVNFKSGLLGISETSSDMKKLLEIEDEDKRAKEAVDFFCYQVKKAIGSLSAAMGGLNTLVFTGGMGENAPKIRTRICDGLNYLGISLDEPHNINNDGVISTGSSQVSVRVIKTDESSTIAKNTWDLINSTGE